MEKSKKLGILNFAYGTGPYLRTAELAIAFNRELEAAGHPRLPFIVPLVYGERQITVMREEFASHERKHPGGLLLDARYGAILKSIFYGNGTYAEALERWTAEREAVEREIRAHLAGRISVRTLTGERRTVDGRDIAVELNRSPRVFIGVAPSYSTTFGHIGAILENALDAPRGMIRVPRTLLRKGIAAANAVEGKQELTAVGYPATFSGYRGYAARYAGEFLTPPISSQFPKQNTRSLRPGVFVTVTGIPGLERLYREAKDLGLALYSNVPQDVPGSRRLLPGAITNKNIKLQFARSGWGSVWLSMVADTPIVVPEFDPDDDPEIYFNNRAVEKLGLGTVYRGQPLREILLEGETIRRNYAIFNKRIMKRWGTLDGNIVAARRFAKDFLHHS